MSKVKFVPSVAGVFTYVTSKNKVVSVTLDKDLSFRSGNGKRVTADKIETWVAPKVKKEKVEKKTAPKTKKEKVEVPTEKKERGGNRSLFTSFLKDHPEIAEFKLDAIVKFLSTKKEGFRVQNMDWRKPLAGETHPALVASEKRGVFVNPFATGKKVVEKVEELT